MNFYLLFKSLHLIAVVSWWLVFYIFPEFSFTMLKINRKRSNRYIWGDGKSIFLHYATRNDFYLGFWISINLFKRNRYFLSIMVQIKIVLVILLSGYNDYLGKCLVALKNSTSTKSAKFFRIINEIPTVILIIVVF